ncbi:MAG: hypothetical protein GKR93_00395 [Gammaproteobacteria bacterium]|nr:hypothetical protein [Gammaproteobacteria bacterium]
MRKIAIVGAGQAGLQLGFALLRAGYEPTLYSDMTAEQITNGPGRPVTIQFGPSVSFEDDLELRFWKHSRYSEIQHVFFSVFSPQGEKLMVIDGEFDKPAQCIDLRMKFGQWLDEFEKRGGRLVIEKCDTDSLENMATTHDLVIVAAGRGQFMEMFEKDQSKTSYSEPQRQVAMFYTQGCDMYRQLDDMPGIRDKQLSRYSVIAGVGEVIKAPFLSKSDEEHHYVQFEAVPGAGMDMFDNKADVAEQYAMGKEWIRQNQPLIYELIEDSETTPEKEWVCGRIPPTVRKPVGTLPSGKPVYAVADAAIVNDPIVAQGLNGASKWMGLLFDQIVAHGEKEFSAEWMQSCFDEYWETAQYNLKFTSTALDGPGPVQQKLMQAASQNQSLAKKFVNCIGEAYKFHPWYWDDKEADKLIAEFSV